MTEGQREKSFMYTAAFVLQRRAGKKKKTVSSQFSISQRSSGKKKKEVCGAADDRGRTVRLTWIPEQHCRQDTEVTSHLCLFYFPLFQGESHYSSLASRGHLTINRDKHWWPLTYPWQWPSVEQNQTLALSSSLSWEWRGASCKGQMASGEGDDGAQWSLEAQIPPRKQGLVFVLTEVYQKGCSFISSWTFKHPNYLKTHFANKYTKMLLWPACSGETTPCKVTPTENTRINVAFLLAQGVGRPGFLQQSKQLSSECRRTNIFLGVAWEKEEQH